MPLSGSRALAPVVVVLAAGRGSRFEGAVHKLRQSLGDESVLAATLAQVLQSGLPAVVVTTAELVPIVQPLIAARDIVLLPPIGSATREPLGMGYSIAAGVGARPNASGWLVLPGDMPLVQATTLQAVARSLGQHPVVYAQHRGRRGHPVGFAAELYTELVRLTGDEGARRLLARYPSQGLEVDDPGVLVDVDTQADLESAQRQRQTRAAMDSGAPA
ncbi:MAG: nucleotidyltransferase family protein [Burkholderiales bacterium]|jgi:molybdenum cofactor cytidylyltransferase|nr:nucleotidyltransferase family protein [Burkholderiales bacterium]MBP7519517.1 nucleotidyltransferase family protein [Leptothrix sp. (in: b-proteobacteria)]HQY08064.1 nucleotidyltransferase family protein [Burkholderiaceae bacterium]